MWESGADWDNLVVESLVKKAQQWYEELLALRCLRVFRCLRAETTVRGITLRTLVDASQEAYGAAKYRRHLYEDGTVTCRLVASKSRVAPLQAIGIPWPLWWDYDFLAASKAFWTYRKVSGYFGQTAWTTLLGSWTEHEVYTFCGESCGWN